MLASAKAPLVCCLFGYWLCSSEAVTSTGFFLGFKSWVLPTWLECLVVPDKKLKSKLIKDHLYYVLYTRATCPLNHICAWCFPPVSISRTKSEKNVWKYKLSLPSRCNIKKLLSGVEAYHLTDSSSVLELRTQNKRNG